MLAWFLMARIAITRDILDGAALMAINAFRLLMLSSYYESRLGMVKITHPVSSIMAALAIITILAGMGIRKIFIMAGVAIHAGLVAYCCIGFARMAGGALQRRRIIINLVVIQAESRRRMVK